MIQELHHIGIAVFEPAAGLAAAGTDLRTEAQRQAGRATYDKYCAQCHGEKGDGQGIAAPHLTPAPCGDFCVSF